MGEIRVPSEDEKSEGVILGASLGGGEEATGTSVSGLSFNGASVSGASVTGASVSGASVTGANVSGASVTGANVSGVVRTVTGDEVEETGGKVGT